MNRRRLQSMIDRCVRRSNASFEAHRALYDECRRLYGCEPGDVDADEILDGVFGAAGMCSGMTAERFDEIMHELAKLEPQS